jgi:ribose 5-phosphate isomerase B
MIAIGADHRGYKLKEEIKQYLEEKEIEYKDFGTNSEEIAHYPQIAEMVAKSVQSKECDKGILICGTGGGMAIVANKFKGIRCEACSTEEAAIEAKSHNNINVIALPADEIDISTAVKEIRAWLGVEFLNGRYLERLKMIEEIEKENMK